MAGAEVATTWSTHVISTFRGRSAPVAKEDWNDRRCSEHTSCVARQPGCIELEFLELCQLCL